MPKSLKPRTTIWSEVLVWLDTPLANRKDNGKNRKTAIIRLLNRLFRLLPCIIYPLQSDGCWSSLAYSLMGESNRCRSNKQ
jgi:hypothetical protein